MLPMRLLMLLLLLLLPLPLLLLLFLLLLLLLLLLPLPPSTRAFAELVLPFLPLTSEGFSRGLLPFSSLPPSTLLAGPRLEPLPLAKPLLPSLALPLLLPLSLLPLSMLLLLLPDGEEGVATSGPLPGRGQASLCSDKDGKAMAKPLK